MSQHFDQEPAAACPTNASGDLKALRSAFSQNPDATIGVEIELFIVDRDTNEPRRLFAEIRDGLPPDRQPQVHDEFLECQIEFVTTPTTDMQDLREQLQNFVDAAESAAAKHNAKLLWKGMLPDWEYDEELVRHYYRTPILERRLGPLVRQLATCGLHIHASVAGRDAIRVMDRLQRFLPLLIALSANSSRQNGLETGRASQRAHNWATGFPVCGLAGPFGDWNAFDRHIDALAEAGLIESQKDLYYFVRPTRYGTLELRCCDMPQNVEQVVTLAALVKTLIVWLQQTRPDARLSSDTLRADLFQASTLGQQAVVTNHRGERQTIIAWLDQLVAELMPHAIDCGTANELEHAVHRLRPTVEHSLATPERSSRLSMRMTALTLATAAALMVAWAIGM